MTSVARWLEYPYVHYICPCIMQPERRASNSYLWLDLQLLYIGCSGLLVFLLVFVLLLLARTALRRGRLLFTGLHRHRRRLLSIWAHAPHILLLPLSIIGPCEQPFHLQNILKKWTAIRDFIIRRCKTALSHKKNSSEAISAQKLKFFSKRDVFGRFNIYHVWKVCRCQVSYLPNRI